MTPAWAQRQEALWRDCGVCSDVFDHMVDRLRDCVVPYQHALATEASQRNVPLSLIGRLSHLVLRFRIDAQVMRPPPDS